jgi:hypothetical protein
VKQVSMPRTREDGVIEVARPSGGEISTNAYEEEL